MELSTILFLSILVVAFLLFSREVYPLEVSALLILVTLVFTGILDAGDALSSFGNPSLVLIGSLFILTAGLKKTGIIKEFEERLFQIGGESKFITFAMILLIVAFLSAFVSNTATMAITIPVVVSLSEKFGDSPRKWLMPVAFASVLGGMNTLIGTSTNIIISSLLPEFGVSQGFTLFTTAHVGLPILCVGLIYLLFFGHFLLGEETSGRRSRSIGVRYDIRSYTSEFDVREDSPLCNKTISDSEFFREENVTILGVTRENHPFLIPRGSLILHPGDRLVVEGDLKELSEKLEKYGLEFHEEVKKAVPKKKSGKTDEHDFGFHEVVVTARSRLNQRTAKEVLLRGRYRMSLIAINRQGETLRDKLSDVRMLAGDILVVQFLDHVDNQSLDHLGLVPLGELSKERYRTKKAPLAAAIFILSLLFGSVSPFPIAITVLAGAMLMVVTNILKPEEIYESIEWRVLLFIGAVLCLGKAMESSGTASALAESLSQLFVSIDPTYALAFFFVLTLVLTQLLSNQATAVVMIPVAINTAQALGVNTMPFIMAVTIAASCCFVTPFEPVFMLVYGPGGYKFTDFFKVGIWLNLLAVGIAVYVIPRVWLL